MPDDDVRAFCPALREPRHGAGDGERRHRLHAREQAKSVQRLQKFHGERFREALCRMADEGGRAQDCELGELEGFEVFFDLALHLEVEERGRGICAEG